MLDPMLGLVSLGHCGCCDERADVGPASHLPPWLCRWVGATDMWYAPHTTCVRAPEPPIQIRFLGLLIG